MIDDFMKEEIRTDFIVTETRKRVWAIELDLLEQLIKICKKYDLKYYAFGGTMLGAVRHNGFIPWDDDIDIGMPREDYNKLCNVANKELEWPYFFQDTIADVDYIDELHARIRNSQTTNTYPERMDYSFNHGIYIDIFPYDVIPKRKVFRGIQSFRIELCYRIIYNYLYSRCINTLKSRVFRAVSIPVCKIFGYKNLYKHLQRISAKYILSNSPLWGVLNLHVEGYNCDNFVWSRSDFSDTVYMTFEHLQLPLPSGYDNVLKVQYGDYMKFPPVESRKHKDSLDDFHVSDEAIRNLCIKKAQ